MLQNDEYLNLPSLLSPAERLINVLFGVVKRLKRNRDYMD